MAVVCKSGHHAVLDQMPFYERDGIIGIFAFFKKVAIKDQYDLSEVLGLANVLPALRK